MDFFMDNYNRLNPLAASTGTCCHIGGGAATPIGHWRSGSETDTPTMSFGVGLFEHRPLRRYFLLQLLIEY